MKYAVLTTKHHDGFCLFDSKYTDFKSTKTPYGKDLVKEWVDAFRAEGLKVGFYYSLLDWHHPDFTIDKIHPLGKNDVTKIPALNKGRDMARYREYMLNQIRAIGHTPYLEMPEKFNADFIDFINNNKKRGTNLEFD